MPYFRDDEDEQNQLQQPAVAPQVKISGASATTDPEGKLSQAATGAGSQAQETGSGFQNLDKYIQANNAKGFGQEVLGKVQGSFDTAQKTQAQVADEYKKRVEGANQLASQEALKQTLGGAGGATEKQVGGSKQEFEYKGPSQQEIEQFQKYKNQTYTGPRGLADTTDLYNKYWSGTSQAKQEAQALGTEGGRFALLDKYFGRGGKGPTYSQGQKGLDNLLLQNAGVGLRSQGLQNQAGALESQGKAQLESLGDIASKRAGEVEANRKLVNDQYAAAQAQAKTDISDRAKNLTENRNKEIDDLLAGFKEGALSRDQMQKLGLSEGQDLYDLDLSNYLNQSRDAVSNEQAATAQQRARLEALSQLGGESQSFLADPTELGSSYAFNKNRFNQDTPAAKSRFQEELAKSFGGESYYTNVLLNQFRNGENPVYPLKQAEAARRSDYAASNPAFARTVDTNIANVRAVLAKYGIDPNTGQSTRKLRVKE